MTVKELESILVGFDSELEVYIKVYNWDQECDGSVTSLDNLGITEEDGKVILHI